MIGRIAGAQHAEARAPEKRGHGQLGQVVRVIDLDGVLNRPLTQVSGAEVDDVDEEPSTIAEQLAEACQGSRDIEQVIDGLTDDHEIECSIAELELLDETGHRLQPM